MNEYNTRAPVSGMTPTYIVEKYLENLKISLICHNNCKSVMQSPLTILPLFMQRSGSRPKGIIYLWLGSMVPFVPSPGPRKYGTFSYVILIDQSGVVPLQPVLAESVGSRKICAGFQHSSPMHWEGSLVWFR